MKTEHHPYKPDGNPWTQSASGKAVDLIDPQPGMIDIQDIAAQLSRLCRFTGGTTKFVSVAEHSVNVALHLRRVGHPPRVQLVGLLHDAHEAYIGDTSTPVQMAMGPAAQKGLKALKTRFDAVIFRTLDVVPLFGSMTDIVQLLQGPVHEADMAVLMAERRDALVTPPRTWGPKLEAVEPSTYGPLGLTPEAAATVFLHHYATLDRLLWPGCAA